ncbi:ATP-binding protein [Rhodobacter lacus]|uniref:ATP-binding protein n=1 Tax=Rhodobacter lacus TaxID=1641972 RepID=A0ABW5AB70_9RHOB
MRISVLQPPEAAAEGVRAGFSTRRSSGGTGMGLAVVRNLLSAHRGGISLATSRPTRFRITFDADSRI